MNHHVEDFLTQAKERFDEDRSDMSYLNWLEQNTTLRGKPFSVEGYEFQESILNDTHPNMDVIKCSQIGMALALDTPIPTPTGWTTMDEIQVGDQVYGENGQICNVQYVSPVYSDHDCYVVKFDDGERIVADGDHKWLVEGRKPFRHDGLFLHQGRPASSSGYSKSGVVDTRTIADNFSYNGRAVFSVPNSSPLEGSSGELELDPYFLGLWLGDGHSASATLTVSEEDLAYINCELSTRGFNVVFSSENSGNAAQMHVGFGGSEHSCPRGHDKRFQGTHASGKCRKCSRQDRGVEESDTRTPKVYTLLRQMGVLKNKHIPDKYKRANENDRLDLLRGLLDSDGSITDGRCSFHNTNETLIRDVQEILSSLGFKYHTRDREPKGNDSVESRKRVYEIGFISYDDYPVFNLPRKASKLTPRSSGKPREIFRRYIHDVEKIDSVPVRCIAVDSPSHLYLAGRSMVPTHNTEVQMRKTLAFLVRNKGIGGIFSLPNEKMYQRVSKTRFKPLVDKEEVFNKTRDSNSVRSMSLMQFGDSFLYLTGCTEGDATSIPADIVMNDEVDISPQQILALYQSRLQNSALHINQRFGTPTFPQYGVDLGFQSSDQNHYLIRCDACNHWQHPEFTTNFISVPGLPDWVSDLSQLDMEAIDQLVLDEAHVKCEKCHRPLDLGNPRVRQWVPKHPSRTRARGYRISPFATARLGPLYILEQLREYRKRDHLRGFFNTVLGLPYTDGNIQLTRDEINECFNGQPTTPEIPAGEPVCVGIDMGQTCHLVLGCGTNPKNMHVFWFKSVHVDDVVEEVRKICNQYTVIAGACDRHPYEPTADDIFKASNGKIIPAEYRGSKEVNLVQDATGAEFSHAQVDRTKMLDEVVRYVRTMPGLTFSGYGHNRETITNHLRDMIRDEQPDQPARWIKLSGEDHFFHALGFLLVSLKIKEVERAKTKSDVRSVLSYSSVDFPDRNGSIFGNGSRESVFG